MHYTLNSTTHEGETSRDAARQAGNSQHYPQTIPRIDHRDRDERAEEETRIWEGALFPLSGNLEGLFNCENLSLAQIFPYSYFFASVALDGQDVYEGQFPSARHARQDAKLFTLNVLATTVAQRGIATSALRCGMY